MQESSNREFDYDADLLDLLDEDSSNTVTETEDASEDFDLIDLLDNAYEKQEVVSHTIEFTSDFEDHAYQSVELDIDIDPSDDTTLFVFDEDEEAEDDLELINSMRTELNEKGYRHLELYDHDGLLKLKNTDDDFINDNVMEIQRSSLVRSFQDIKSYIQVSRATLIKAKANIKMEDAAMPNPRHLDAEFAILVWETVCKCVNENRHKPNLHEIVTANYVVTRLMQDKLPAQYSYYTADYDFYKYLEDAIPLAITTSQANYQQLTEVEKQREKVASYLLQSEQKAIEHLEKSNCDFIKQIFRRNHNYVYYCAECQEEVKLQDNILSYIMYDTEKANYTRVAIPRLIICPKCGKEHLLPFIWYANIAEHLQKEYVRGADEIFKFLSKVSTGTAVTKINPSLELLMEGIDPIVTLDGDNNFEQQIVQQDNTSKNIVFSDEEYQKAIMEFSNRLLLYDAAVDIKMPIVTPNDSIDDIDNIDNITFANSEQTKNDNYLSFKELAICMASELSMDYKSIKNKALYSLIMSLNEYDFIREQLDRSNYWNLRNRLIILHKLDKVTDNDKELISIFKNIYQDIMRTPAGSDEVMLQILREYRDKLPNTIAKLEQDYVALVNEIKRNMDLFAHTRILNINQISYKLLTFYVNDSQLSELLDDITDKMIVNNYAEKFAHTLFRSSVLNNSNIRTTLTEIADGHRIASTILSYLDRNYGYVFADTVYKRLSYVTASHLNLLKTAADALKSYEYYNFIEALANITDFNTLISLTADEKLEHAVSLAKDELMSFNAKSYYDYYLRDFETQDLETLESSYRARLLKISFGRYVPKRLNNESLAEYIERYELLAKDNHLSIVDCYDYMDEFNKFKDYFIIIMNGHNVLDLERDNFALANFTRCWLHLCSDNFSRQESLHLLGYDDKYFRRLKALNTYKISTKYFEGVSSLYKVLYGNYYGPTTEFIQKYLSEYEKKTLTERDSLENFMETSVDTILNDIEDLEESDIRKLEQSYNTIKRANETINKVDEDSDFSKEDLINEIELYAGRIQL